MKLARFSIVQTLSIAGAAGFLVGGAWSWTGFLALVAVGLGLDLVAGEDLDEGASAPGWLYDALLFLHLPVVLATSGAFIVLCNRGPDTVELLGGILSLGLIYASGTVVAHELVHRLDSPIAMTVGRWLLAFTGDASFAIEHVHGHHLNVATPEDPATARRGENVYAFTLRSTLGSYRSAWAIEKRRLERLGHSVWSWRSRMHRGNLMTIVLAGIFYAFGGGFALSLFVVTAIYGKAYLEFVNYIEHYGLVRVPGTPVEPRHSWNCTRRMSTWLTFNLPRHSHHHAMAHIPYWNLRSMPDAPMLPYGYLTMIFIAAIPPLFNSIMDPLVSRWDDEYATGAERALVT